MLIHEVMSRPVITLAPDDTVRRAARVLLEHGIASAPVVDAAGRLVGVVSEADLMRGRTEPDPRAHLIPSGQPVDLPADRVAEALGIKAGRRVELAVPQRGEKRAVVLHAETNAREALERKLAESAGQAKLLEGVAATFGLPAAPERIECYDNSHIMGAHAYGVMVVAGPEGFIKNAYRKYGIRGPIAPGDDFAMMREMLERRFGRAAREQAASEAG